MVWSKEYKTTFAEKYPHLDASQNTSKRMNDVWAGIPAGEKKMWKNRAAKQMKSGENMKNTAPPPVQKVPKKKKLKLKTLAGLEGLSQLKTKITGKKKITGKPKGKGKGKRKHSESSFNSDGEDIIAPPPKSLKQSLTVKPPAKGYKAAVKHETKYIPPPPPKKNGRKSPAKGGGNLNVASMRAVSTIFSK